MKVQSHSSLESSINVTPLVDVCLPQRLEVTVKSDGSLYLGTLVVWREQASSELAKLHAKSPERAIAVRGDKDVPYGDVVEVLDACRAAGYDDVKLVTQRRESSTSR
jgi:biopolymer transport protein ExbD